jgi:hypothetical protein
MPSWVSSPRSTRRFESGSRPTIPCEDDLILQDSRARLIVLKVSGRLPYMRREFVWISLFRRFRFNSRFPPCILFSFFFSGCLFRHPVRVHRGATGLGRALRLWRILGAELGHDASVFRRGATKNAHCVLLCMLSCLNCWNVFRFPCQPGCFSKCSFCSDMAFFQRFL